jgi:hypothetical protein
MSDLHRHPPDPTDLSEPGEPSREALTPRGGFMARPGLKEPPRHAVVVRVGDAPATGEIPLARQSKPPPAPVLVQPEAVPTQDDKVTLRAIPTPSAPRAVEPPPVFDSVPPPSDMPVVASVRAPESARAQTSHRSGAAILVAAAAGIALGLGSVVMSRWVKPASPVSEQRLEPIGVAAEQPAQPAPLASSAPAPSQRAEPAASAASPVSAPPKPARRAIF